MKKIITILVAVLFSLLIKNNSYSHCQIPCGIYGDDGRFVTLIEHVATLKKSVEQINEISGAESINQNQLVRWVMNKEKHADDISQIVLYYFLAQRIKADQADYEKKLVSLHKIIVLAMKAKQNSSLEIVSELESAIQDFHNLYHPEHSHSQNQPNNQSEQK